MKHSSIILFLLISTQLFSQIAVKGTTDPIYKGQVIEALRLGDFITNTEEQLGTGKVADDGTFAVSFFMEETSPVYLRIGTINAYLYAENGQTYKVHFPKWERDEYYQAKDQKVVQLEWIEKNELNEKIIAFDNDYNTYLRENYLAMAKKSAYGKTDTFKLEMSKKYGDYDNSFFNSFVTYSLASVGLAAGHSTGKVYKGLFLNKPILYHNDAYMDLFNQFYGGNFKVYASKDPAVVKAINEDKSLEKLKTALQANEYVQGDQLTELFIIDGVLSSRFDNTFNLNGIKAVLREIENKSTFAENRKIAGNAHSIINRLRAGSIAPNFELLNEKGKTVQLNDFKGKYVYLDFWATWCTPCIREMKIMPTLVKEYGKAVEFISISIDKDENKMKKFVKDNKDYDWTFLHFANQPEILEQYNVKGVPMYYLINPEGVIIQSPAYRPSADKFIGTMEKAKEDIEVYKNKD